MFRICFKIFVGSKRTLAFTNGIKGTTCTKPFTGCLDQDETAYNTKIFMILSSVDLRWNEQLPITNKLNKQDLADKDIQTLSNHDRCKFLNSNPAFIVRHFQCQVEIRFKKIIVDGTLRKVI